MLNRRTLILAAASAPFVATLGNRAFAGVAPVYANNGIAIDGSDAVAYFTEGAPVSGSDTLTFDWMGATWRFSNAKNRDMFADDPIAYAPQYGGYCAYAVSEGYTASTVPQAWKVVDGKLYLNFSRRIQRRWERNIPERIAAGDQNWPKLVA